MSADEGRKVDETAASSGDLPVAVEVCASASSESGDIRPVRVCYFEWVRAFGALAIVFLHAWTTVSVAAGGDALGPVRLIGWSVATAALTRWAVPLFFMISGALMLDPARKMDWRKIGHHVWRLVFVLLTFGLAFCLIEQVVHAGWQGSATIAASLANLACARSWDHLWFVYELIGLYLLTPFIRPYIARASSRELGWVVLGAYVILQVIPTVSTYSGVALWPVVRLPWSLVYFVGGYWVHHALRGPRIEFCCLFAGLVGFILMLVLVIMDPYSKAILPQQCFVWPFSVAVMLGFRRWFERPCSQPIAVLSSYSFGIYIIHPAFMHAFCALFGPFFLPAGLEELVLFVIGLAGSMGLTWLLRHVPGFAGKI